MIDIIAFDLDDTLYDEGEYFAAAFEAVADELSRSAAAPRDEVLRRLARLQREKGRQYHRLFNDLLRELHLDEGAHLGRLLFLFKRVRPRLNLFPGAAELLRDLARAYRLGLVTSGMRDVQENKLRLLRVADYFERIIFSSTLPENKPRQLPFRRLLETMKASPERAAYVGDNPWIDFKGANELGMITVRVRNRAFDGCAVPEGYDAHVHVGSLDGLRSLFPTQGGSPCPIRTETSSAAAFR